MRSPHLTIDSASPWRRALGGLAATLVCFVAVTGCGERRQQDETGAGTVDTAAGAADTAATTTPADTGAARGAGASSGTGASPEGRQQAATPEPAGGDTAQASAGTGGAGGQTSTDTGQAAASGGQGGGQTTTAQAPPQGARANDPYHQAPKDTVSPAVYDGWKQFQLNCARCHGETGDGTSFAPSLTESLKSKRINKQGFMQTVCAERPERGMPAWCKLGMEMKTIDNIHAWVQERADGKVGPERPAVRES